jgi:putative ABC transport system permease protein
VLIATGNDVANDTGDPVRFLGGIVAMVLAVVFAAGPATKLLGRLAPRVPITPRLAMRDVERNRGRAGPALAAASLTIAIATALVIGAAAAEDGVDEGNLAAEQVLLFPAVREFPIQRVEPPTDEDAAEVDRIAASFDATAVPLEVPTDDRGNPLVLGFPVSENTVRDAGPIYVATPEVLDHLGVSVDSGRRLLSYRPGPLHLVGDIEDLPFRSDGVPADWIQHVDVPAFSSAPRTLLTEEAIDDLGLRTAPVGWLLQRDRPWTATELATLRDEVVAVELGMETRSGQGGLSSLRTIAASVGALLALAILAMALGLMRSEAAADTRTLVAIGASRSARRAVAAHTAASLAVLAVLIGTATAYAAMIAGYWTAPERMGPPPVAHLAAVLIGVPLVATAASWLLGASDRATRLPT